jgi:epoxyqueuosine reductase QueG
MPDDATAIDLQAAKEKLLDYALSRGAAAVGIADVDLVEKYAPPGYGPRALLPRARAVISVGVTGPTQGTWRTPAKVMTSIGTNVSRIYRVAMGLAFRLEGEFGYRAIYCPPHVDPELGARHPMQSLKLHAELAGTGARSMAGDILLHPDFGMLYYGSVFTEMPLPPDGPLADNPCPAPSCVSLYRQTGKTPCMQNCPVECLSGSIDDSGEIAEMNFDMFRCAEMCQQYENMPTIIERAIEEGDMLEREQMLYGGEAQSYFYKATAGVDTNAQCFECMRVCPIATQGPEVDPVRRGALKRAARGTDD